MAKRREGPSPHVSWKELACHDADRTPYPVTWRVSRAIPLAVEFEHIRAVVGRPILVGSAYRTLAHNRRVGGAEYSQHPEGRALDLYPPVGWTLARFYKAVREVAMRGDSLIYGLGRYRTFVHIDTRQPPPHGRLIAWRGQRAWAEVKNGKRAA